MVNEGQIIELKKEIADLKAEIAALKAEKAESQEKSTVMGNIPETAVQPMKRFLEESSDLNAQEDAKKLKLSAEKRPTNVPNWLIEVLAWISRIEMANSALSFSTWTFSQLCWPKLHGNVQPHFVKPLRFIWKRNDELGVLQAKLFNTIGAEIPIASVPPPNYINGFTKIQINFFDGQVLKFIESVQPILNEIRLFFHLPQISIFDTPCPVASGSFIQIRRLFDILANKAVAIYDPPFFDFLSSYPNATSIVENENFQSVTTKLYLASNFDLPIKWLTKSWIDKKPKWLHIDTSIGNTLSEFIDQIKERFISSTQPANFVITFEYQWNIHEYANFVLENEQTGELLAIYPTPDNKKFIARHPMGTDGRLWPIWACQVEKAKTSIAVQIQQIGTIFPQFHPNPNNARHFHL